MKFGRFDITTVEFGSFRLDGGAMFGSVPKNLWAKRISPDEENCITLATRSLLIRDEKRLFLLDVGMGEKWNEKSRQIFAIRNNPCSSWGFDPNEITDVVLTHLHFDHAGGISYFKADGSLSLTFPGARVYLQEANWRNARNPTLKERASYLKENVEILKEARLELVRGSFEIYPDLWVHQVNGHTEGQQVVEIRAGDEVMVFPTDLIPTSHHLPVPYHMGYDICAGTILKEKDEYLARVEQQEAIVVFQHDPAVAAATVKRDERGQFCIRETVSL